MLWNSVIYFTPFFIFCSFPRKSSISRYEFAFEFEYKGWKCPQKSSIFLNLSLSKNGWPPGPGLTRALLLRKISTLFLHASLRLDKRWFRVCNFRVRESSAAERRRRSTPCPRWSTCCGTSPAVRSQSWNVEFAFQDSIKPVFTDHLSTTSGLNPA